MTILDTGVNQGGSIDETTRWNRSGKDPALHIDEVVVEEQRVDCVEVGGYWDKSHNLGGEHRPFSNGPVGDGHQHYRPSVLESQIIQAEREDHRDDDQDVGK
jgi:hypothetical protein